MNKKYVKGGRGSKGRTEDQRFMDLVEIDAATGCWIWTGPMGGQRKYGQFKVGSMTDGTRRDVRAHRWAYERWVGPIPEGKELDHFVCNRPACVNPKHLRPVTRWENLLRGNSPVAKNKAKTHCANGHCFAEHAYYWKSSRQCRQCKADWDARNKAKKKAAA